MRFMLLLNNIPEEFGTYAELLVPDADEPIHISGGRGVWGIR